MKYSINILLLVIFIFSIGSNTLVSNSRVYNKTNPDSKSIAEITTEDEFNFTSSTCCCDMTMRNSDNCCCKSPTLGSNAKQFAANQAEGSLFNVFISSVKCFNNTNNLQVVSLSDYEYLYPNISVFLFKKTGFLTDINDNRISDLIVVLLYRPPREKTDNLFSRILTHLQIHPDHFTLSSGGEGEDPPLLWELTVG